jgi:small-conductance mechanosensitive channel
MIAMTARRLAAAAALGLASATAFGATPAEPADRPPSITETLTAVRQISHELKRIEERLGALEQSVTRVEASLRPVGALAQPAELRGLILLATACGAGLIILHAAVRRWFPPTPGK